MIDILSAWEQWILQKEKEERDAAEVKLRTEQEIETRAQEERAELEKKKAEMADKAPRQGPGWSPGPQTHFGTFSGPQNSRLLRWYHQSQTGSLPSPLTNCQLIHEPNQCVLSHNFIL